MPVQGPDLAEDPRRPRRLQALLGRPVMAFKVLADDPEPPDAPQPSPPADPAAEPAEPHLMEIAMPPLPGDPGPTGRVVAWC